MDFIIDAIVEWLKGLLVDGIMGNLDGLFNNVNQSVGEIATQVGTTPADWNAGVFSMIRQISETAILPIAGVILTFVMTYELIQMLIDRNNLHDIDTWMFFKWVFKTFVAVMILTNTFNIVLAVFDVSQHVIQQSAGIIQNGTEITTDVMDSLRTELEAMELGPLFGLWLQSFLIQLTMIALNIVIFVIVYGRMIEIYLLTSLAPIPFATVPNRETGHMGRTISAPSLRWAFKACSFWSVSPSMRCLSRVSPPTEIPLGRSGAVWAIRCCCVLPCSKRAALQNPSSAAIKRLRAMLTRSGKEAVCPGVTNRARTDSRTRLSTESSPRNFLKQTPCASWWKPI